MVEFRKTKLSILKRPSINLKTYIELTTWFSQKRLLFGGIPPALLTLHCSRHDVIG